MTGLDERHRRILTTHTGSLPRADALSALLFARMTKKPYDADRAGPPHDGSGRRDRQGSRAISASMSSVTANSRRRAFKPMRPIDWRESSRSRPRPANGAPARTWRFRRSIATAPIRARRGPDGPASARSNISARRRLPPICKTSKARCRSSRPPTSSCRRFRRRAAPDSWRTASTRTTRNMSSPWRRRCARNTRRSSRRASRCRSTIPASPCTTCSAPTRT